MTTSPSLIWPLGFLTLAVVLGLPACSSSTNAGTGDGGDLEMDTGTLGCIPGIVVSCSSGDECIGTQVCDVDGSAFGPCSCSSTPDASVGEDAPGNLLCSPGVEIVCGGLDGCLGLETCSADGLSYGPCGCISTDAAGTASTTPDATVSSSGFSDAAEEADGSDAAGPCGDGGALDADFEIHTASDVETLAGVCEVTGDIVVNAPGLTSLVLPSLRRLGGTLALSNAPDLTAISLPALFSAGAIGSFLGSDPPVTLPRLTAISAPTLTSASWIDLATNVSGEEVSVSLPSLAGPSQVTLHAAGSGAAQIDLHALAHGSVAIEDAEVTQLALPSYAGDASSSLSLLRATLPQDLSFPELVSLQGLTVQSCEVTSLAFPVLALLSGVAQIESNDALATLSMPSLATAQQINVEANPILTSLSLPALTSAAQLVVDSDDTLDDVSAPLLVSLDPGPLFVASNPDLPSCAATALLTQLRAHGYAGGADVDGDTGAGTCP